MLLKEKKQKKKLNQQIKCRFSYGNFSALLDLVFAVGVF